MGRSRRNHSPEVKVEVALAAAQGDLTMAELACRQQAGHGPELRYEARNS